MMVVKVEVWPFGSEEEAYELDRIYLVNQGRQSWQNDLYDYGLFFNDPRGRMNRTPDKIIRRHLRDSDQNDPSNKRSVRRLLSRAFTNIHLVKPKDTINV